MKIVVMLMAVMWLSNGVMALPPVQASKWHHKGIKAMKLGDAETAISHYANALSHSPNQGETLFNLGNAFYAKGDMQNAKNAYTNAISKLPKQFHGNVYYNIGNAYMKIRDYDSAVSAYKEALKRQPMDRDAKRNIEIATQLNKTNRHLNPPEPSEDQDQNLSSPRIHVSGFKPITSKYLKIDRK